MRGAAAASIGRLRDMAILLAAARLPKCQLPPGKVYPGSVHTIRLAMVGSQGACRPGGSGKLKLIGAELEGARAQ